MNVDDMKLHSTRLYALQMKHNSKWYVIEIFRTEREAIQSFHERSLGRPDELRIIRYRENGVTPTD